MAKEMRLIDANELADRLNHTTMVAYPNLFPGLVAAIEVVDDSPTVEAVEVVRCEIAYTVLNILMKTDCISVAVYKRRMGI